MEQQVIGAIVMESVSEPMKPKILQTVNEPNMFFVRFETCLQSFDCFNRNKRNYNSAPMKEAFSADHIVELLRKGTWVGENGHPDSENIKRILTIDPTKICHRICDYNFRGNMVYATIETLNDDGYGKQFSRHILQGLHPSFSLRALAAITKLGDGRGIIKTRPHIVTYDRVILPSHKEAYMDNSKEITVVKSATEAYDVYSDYEPATENSYIDAIYSVQESTSLIDYIKDESKNVKDIVSFFDAELNKVKLVKEDTLLIDNGEKKYHVYLEDYIQKDINDYFIKLNNEYFK